MITSKVKGNDVEFVKDKWFYKNTNVQVADFDGKKCFNCKRTVTPVEVTIIASKSHTGKEHKKVCPIDSCISSIVNALESGGVKMFGSCCGHGDIDGSILLADGRRLIIKNGNDKNNKRSNELL